VPTGKVIAPSALDRDERRVFDLVARRFLGAFHPDAEFAVTEVVVRVGTPEAAGQARPPGRAAKPEAEDESYIDELPSPPDRFLARGRVRLVAGWQEVAGLGDDPGAAAEAPGGGARRDPRRGEGEAPESAALARLPVLVEGQRLDGQPEIVARQTRPPPRHTEATLLAAMETAGRSIEDDELRAAMKDVGLGTPATRAATIETLLKRAFIEREGKQLRPTDTGTALLRALPVGSLASPELTGTWEARLARIARGEESRAAFMRDIVAYVSDVVGAIRGGPAAAAASRGATASPGPRPTPSRERGAPTPPATVAKAAATACPRCKQGALVAGNRGWGCSRWRDGCAFVVWFEVAGKRLTDAQLRDLLTRGKTRPGKWQIEGVVRGGRLVLDLSAPRERGAARFEPG
jgi:DNA topoisomerase-3